MDHTWVTDQSKSSCVKSWLRSVRQTDKQTPRQTDRQTNQQNKKTIVGDENIKN